MHNNNVKFSIVTIVYNGESYIEDTINSVISQKYDNFEYVIIDGGSADDTMNIVDKYKNRLTKIISEKDKGLYDAMNKGIDNCKGDFVIFMNGGDMFADINTLKKISEISGVYTYDFIFGDSIVKFGENESFYKKARSWRYYWYGMFANHQAMIYKLSLIRNNKIKYDLKYKICADYKFTLEFLKISKEKFYINCPICVFLHGGISVQLRNVGLKEANIIRREVLGYNKLKILGITFLIYLSRTLEDYFSWFHRLLRFS